MKWIYRLSWNQRPSLSLTRWHIYAHVCIRVCRYTGECTHIFVYIFKTSPPPSHIMTHHMYIYLWDTVQFEKTLKYICIYMGGAQICASGFMCIECSRVPPYTYMKRDEMTLRLDLTPENRCLRICLCSDTYLEYLDRGKSSVKVRVKHSFVQKLSNIMKQQRIHIWNSGHTCLQNLLYYSTLL